MKFRLYLFAVALSWLFLLDGNHLAFALQVTPSSLSSMAVQGGANPPTQTITLSAFSPRVKSWTATSTEAWLTISPSSGSATSGSAQFSASVNATNLSPGSYSGIISINVLSKNSVKDRVNVPVTLTVSASPTSISPVLSLSSSGLIFSGTAGGTNPVGKAVTVTNTGGGMLNWTASAASPWLTISPSSGTNAGTLTALVNLAGLAAGTYSGVITVSATGVSSQYISVTLTVTPGLTSTPSATLTPTTLAFTSTVGANPASKTFTIINSTGGTLTWTLSDNASWLTTNSVSGTTTTETDVITTNVNTAGLASGTYNATITLTASGASNSPQTIPVSLTLAAASTTSAMLMWSANTEPDLAGYKIYRATASGAYGAPIATIDKAQTSYASTGLQTGTTYYFSITAYDTAGNESAYSTEVSKSIF